MRVRCLFVAMLVSVVGLYSATPRAVAQVPQADSLNGSEVRLPEGVRFGMTQDEVKRVLASDLVRGDYGGIELEHPKEWKKKHCDYEKFSCRGGRKGDVVHGGLDFYFDPGGKLGDLVMYVEVGLSDYENAGTLPPCFRPLANDILERLRTSYGSPTRTKETDYAGKSFYLWVDKHQRLEVAAWVSFGDVHGSVNVRWTRGAEALDYSSNRPQDGDF